MNLLTAPVMSDTDIKANILSELKYEPSVKTSDIGVLVKNGTVTLNGNATSYWEKLNAIRAAQRVAGVNGIADDIQVKLPNSFVRTDADIAAAAMEQIKWSTIIPHGAVNLTVREGWITLHGKVEWWYEKNAADHVIHNLIGVRGVSNEITVEPKLSATMIEKDIQAAFKRSAMFDADEVVVTTSGAAVTLRGKVRTHGEKYEAERTAWAASGVKSVDNELTVRWSWLSD
jgi:osmotically-inducible protein OsmY